MTGLSEPLRQIIALGSGLTNEPGQPTFLPYVLAACGRKNPHILFLPTAAADSDRSLVGFYQGVSRLNCRASHLSLFNQPIDMEARVEQADIIQVAGGNTRNLIALWRASGLDLLLRAAWVRGTLLCGVSAGAVCWFEDAQTTSTGSLGAVGCLGFLAGSCSTHYDSNPERRPHLHKSIGEGSISSGYGVSDLAGLHFYGTVLHAALACEAGRKVFQITRNADGTVCEKELPTRLVN